MAVNDLLLPIVKGYGSELWVLLGTESLQTLGGSGFLTDYLIEQYVRDAKIDTLYEGTTAIQGQDFFFRKIVGTRAVRSATWPRRSRRSSPPRRATAGSRSSACWPLPRGRQRDRRRDDQRLMSADASAEGGDVRNIYKVGLNTSRLLMALGDVVCAWLLLRGADVALTKLAGDVSAKDQAFYEGMVSRRSSSPRTCCPAWPPSGRSPSRPTWR